MRFVRREVYADPMAVFYRPEDSALGDVIPFAYGDAFHLFYLRDFRSGSDGPATPWQHLVTRDFVDFGDWGEALARGGPDAQDDAVYTGCVIEDRGLFHIFYTGHNGRFRGQGRPSQVIMHATSTDLRSWTKDPSIVLPPPADGYEQHDWRDPFVYREEGSGGFSMLLAARRDSGPARYRGITARCTSTDLSAWQVAEPFFAPAEFSTHECPDLFRIGDWWYLVFSEFSSRTVTRYRMSRQPDGPWMTPPDDALDSRAWYAAKTAAVGAERFGFGWVPTRDGATDSGPWQWAGTLVVHRIDQRPDGTLSAHPPRSVLVAFGRAQDVVPGRAVGEWRAGGDRTHTDATGRRSSLLLGAMPDPCLIEVDVTLDAAATQAGLLLRAGEDGDTGYELRIEPSAQRVVLDRWPRPGDEPIALYRPLAVVPGRPVRLRAIADGTTLACYADDVALCGRMYDHASGAVGIFAGGGIVTFGGLSVRLPS